MCAPADLVQRKVPLAPLPDYAHDHDVRQRLIDRPFPPLRSIVYGGAPWAGTIVTEFFSQLDTLPLSRILKSHEYDGVYRDGVNLTPRENMVLFGDKE